MFGTADAFSGPIMKTNGILTGKFVLLLGIVCAVMLASGTDVNANRVPLPPSINPVPDGGTTAMLFGAALGALGMVRRFFWVKNFRVPGVKEWPFESVNGHSASHE